MATYHTNIQFLDGTWKRYTASTQPSQSSGMLIIPRDNKKSVIVKLSSLIQHSVHIEG